MVRDRVMVWFRGRVIVRESLRLRLGFQLGLGLG